MPNSLDDMVSLTPRFSGVDQAVANAETALAVFEEALAARRETAEAVQSNQRITSTSLKRGVKERRMPPRA